MNLCLVPENVACMESSESMKKVFNSVSYQAMCQQIDNVTRTLAGVFVEVGISLLSSIWFHPPGLRSRY